MVGAAVSHYNALQPPNAGTVSLTAFDAIQHGSSYRITYLPVLLCVNPWVLGWVQHVMKQQEEYDKSGAPAKISESPTDPMKPCSMFL